MLWKLFGITDIYGFTGYENVAEEYKSTFFLTDFLTGILLLYIFSIPVVRRFHDLDKGGEKFFFMLVPIFNLVYIVRLMFEKGTVGPNQYGPDPQNPTDQDVFTRAVKCPRCRAILDVEYTRGGERTFTCPVCNSEITV